MRSAHGSTGRGAGCSSSAAGAGAAPGWAGSGGGGGTLRTTGSAGRNDETAGLGQLLLMLQPLPRRGTLSVAERNTNAVEVALQGFELAAQPFGGTLGILAALPLVLQRASARLGDALGLTSGVFGLECPGDCVVGFPAGLLFVLDGQVAFGQGFVAQLVRAGGGLLGLTGGGPLAGLGTQLVLGGLLGPGTATSAI
jgi:hypothetical protein